MSTRLGLSPINADKMLMAVATDEMLDAINIPLRTRKGRFVLDYVGQPFPVLLQCAPGISAEPICRIHTRGPAPRTEMLVPRDSQLQLIVTDMAERLAKVPASLVIAHSKDRQGRKYARLQVIHGESRYVALTLHGTWKGFKSEPIGPFAAPELKLRPAA